MKYSERITYDVEKDKFACPGGTAFFVKVIGDIQEFVFSHTILNVIEVRDTKDNDAVIVITAKDLLIVRRRSLRPLRLKGFHSRSISFFICDDWFVDSISFARVEGNKWGEKVSFSILFQGYYELSRLIELSSGFINFERAYIYDWGVSLSEFLFRCKNVVLSPAVISSFITESESVAVLRARDGSRAEYEGAAFFDIATKEGLREVGEIAKKFQQDGFVRLLYHHGVNDLVLHTNLVMRGMSEVIDYQFPAEHATTIYSGLRDSIQKSGLGFLHDGREFSPAIDVAWLKAGGKAEQVLANFQILFAKGYHSVIMEMQARGSGRYKTEFLLLMLLASEVVYHDDYLYAILSSVKRFVAKEIHLLFDEMGAFLGSLRSTGALCCEEFFRFSSVKGFFLGEKVQILRPRGFFNKRFHVGRTNWFGWYSDMFADSKGRLPSRSSTGKSLNREFELAFAPGVVVPMKTRTFIYPLLGEEIEFKHADFHVRAKLVQGKLQIWDSRSYSVRYEIVTPEVIIDEVSVNMVKQVILRKRGTARVIVTS